MTLGGNIVIRNGNELDFCWRECVQSILPVCDVVCLCDGESTDGTQEEIREWMTRESKLRLCVYPWPNPKGDHEFFVKWCNYAREHVTADYQFQIDADEILDESSHDAVRDFMAQADGKCTARISRLNFWKDNRHTIPAGQCLAHEVIRLAPQNMWLPSDGSTGHPLEGIPSGTAKNRLGIRLFHYGFLRERKAMFKKEKALQNFFFNTFDPRMEAAESLDGNWMEAPNLNDFQNSLDEYNGRHPAVIHQWLKDRNYAP